MANYDEYEEWAYDKVEPGKEYQGEPFAIASAGIFAQIMKQGYVEVEEDISVSIRGEVMSLDDIAKK